MFDIFRVICFLEFKFFVFIFGCLLVSLVLGVIVRVVVFWEKRDDVNIGF